MARDAAVFPEVVEVAHALLDPVIAELVWQDSGAGRPRALPADGAFCRRLGERVGRRRRGPLAAVDFDGPLTAWMGVCPPTRASAGPIVAIRRVSSSSGSGGPSLAAYSPRASARSASSAWAEAWTRSALLR
ncbi:hypothetical protein ACFWNL_17275 [Kitasatospora sp. NPDC058397]|uniref:hypothetical protein n=1 Tax=unclassified Kitasatospora TaxID=2633591 RepID=UPI00364B75F7